MQIKEVYAYDEFTNMLYWCHVWTSVKITNLLKHVLWLYCPWWFQLSYVLFLLSTANRTTSALLALNKLLQTEVLAIFLVEQKLLWYPLFMYFLLTNYRWLWNEFYPSADISTSIYFIIFPYPFLLIVDCFNCSASLLFVFWICPFLRLAFPLSVLF